MDQTGSFEIPSVPAYFRPLSLRLFSVLDGIGASEEVRKVRMETCVTREILMNVHTLPERSVYYFGSRADGTTTDGMESDIDRVYILNNVPVVNNPSEHREGTSLLLIQDSTTPAGYCKLQLVQDGVPQNGDVPAADPYPDEQCRICLQFRVNSDNQRVCYFEPSDVVTRLYDRRHGPAMTKDASLVKISKDTVRAVECKNPLKLLQKWLARNKRFDWPTGEVLQACKTLGCLFVPVGHPNSIEHDQQWRISMSHQEKLLVTQFSTVQFKCFILLKMINKDFIVKPFEESLSSYHIKTCMFFVIENTPCTLWKPDNLLLCLSLCLRKLLEWVKSGFCPNYFILEENMFERHIHGSVRTRLQHVLQQLVFADCKFLPAIQCDRLGERLIHYVLTPAIYTEDDVNISYLSKMMRMREVCEDTFYNCILHLTCIRENGMDTLLNKILKSIFILHYTTTITRHSIQQTQKAKMLILPYLELAMMSNAVAFAVDQNLQSTVIWHLLVSKRWKETCLSSDSYSSRLKQASMLYMLGYYQASIDVMSTLTGLVRYACCSCYIDVSTVVLPDATTLMNTTRQSSYVSPECLIRNVIIPCVYFLPTEKSVTPAALCYEMRRMRDPRQGKNSYLGRHNRRRGDWAFVDGNFLHHFLLYLNHNRLNMIDHVTADIDIMYALLVCKTDIQISHIETCFNLLGWVFKDRGKTKLAERFFIRSLQIEPHCNAAFQHLIDLLYDLVCSLPWERVRSTPETMQPSKKRKSTV